VKNRVSDDKRAGALWGSFIGDALAMPVHWYYDRAALKRDYGIARDYLAPRNPHPDSILWRSAYTPINGRGDILHEQAQYWGQRGIHYHQFLRAGENTLNLQLGWVLIESLVARGRYDAEDYLQRYLDFMLTPGRHRDAYVEECHRKFFGAYARGTHPRKCGGSDIHIGGLAHVGVLLMANLVDRLPDPRRCLGGFEEDGRPVHTLRTLQALLGPHFLLARTLDLPFLIREHARKFQWSVAQATVWIRR
jgi:ADP-ribosylglycohydrolase